PDACATDLGRSGWATRQETNRANKAATTFSPRRAFDVSEVGCLPYDMPSFVRLKKVVLSPAKTTQ
ncbi:MAG TPA: hypothetical protein VEJ84_21705, partial [Acidimicrobiales bacterium]|nr:hypothetical protein [Acidimicrobiales bacterium]